MRCLPYCRPISLHSLRYRARSLAPSYTRCGSWTHHTFATQSREVRVGGSGNVKLDIYHATDVQSVRTPSVLVHLLCGPQLVPTSRSLASDDRISETLASELPSTTVVAINYRLSPPYTASKPPDPDAYFRFPQPIHDVSEAFAHIVEHLVPSLFTDQDWPQILLYGRSFGGALAAMLALTAPNQVDAVAIENPMLDWVMLDELMNRSEPEKPVKRKHANTTELVDNASIRDAVKDLIDTRTKIFPKPSNYFDPFASPTLFLRAPGRDTPKTHTEALGLLGANADQQGPTDDWVTLADNDEYADGDWQETSKPHHVSEVTTESPADTIAESIGSFGPYDDDLPPPNLHASNDDSASIPSGGSTETSSKVSDVDPGSTTGSDVQTRPVRRRKVLRRWPPNQRSEDVSLPHFNVIVSERPASGALDSSDADKLNNAVQEILRVQGTEFSDLLKRACFFGQERSVAEERVTLTATTDGSTNRPSKAALEWLRMRVNEAA